MRNNDSRFELCTNEGQRLFLRVDVLHSLCSLMTIPAAFSTNVIKRFFNEFKYYSILSSSPSILILRLNWLCQFSWCGEPFQKHYFRAYNVTTTFKQHCFKTYFHEIRHDLLRQHVMLEHYRFLKRWVMYDGSLQKRTRRSLQQNPIHLRHSVSRFFKSILVDFAICCQNKFQNFEPASTSYFWQCHFRPIFNETTFCFDKFCFRNNPSSCFWCNLFYFTLLDGRSIRILKSSHLDWNTAEISFSAIFAGVSSRRPLTSPSSTSKGAVGTFDVLTPSTTFTFSGR